MVISRNYSSSLLPNRNHTIRNSDRTQVRGAVATTYKNIVDDNKILRCEDVFKPWSTFKDRLVNMGNVFEILTEVRLEHSSKADEEIKVTLSGILMEVSL